MRPTRTQQVVSFFTSEPLDSARTLLEVVTGIVNDRDSQADTPTPRRRGGRRRKVQEPAAIGSGD